MAAKLPLFKYFLVPYILISFKNILVCILLMPLNIISYLQENALRGNMLNVY